MWADGLSADDRSTVVHVMGRLGELVAELNIDHVALVATLVDPDVTPDRVLLELDSQIAQHDVFIQRLRRIVANLETVAQLLRATPSGS